MRAAIVVAFAPGAFLVFVVPHSVAFTPREVIGERLMGVVVGPLFATLSIAPAGGEAAQQSPLPVRCHRGSGSEIRESSKARDGHRTRVGGWHRSGPGCRRRELVSAPVLSIVRTALLPKLSDLLRRVCSEAISSDLFLIRLPRARLCAFYEALRN